MVHYYAHRTKHTNTLSHIFNQFGIAFFSVNMIQVKRLKFTRKSQQIQTLVWQLGFSLNSFIFQQLLFSVQLNIGLVLHSYTADNKQLSTKYQVKLSNSYSNPKAQNKISLIFKLRRGHINCYFYMRPASVSSQTLPKYL